MIGTMWSLQRDYARGSSLRYIRDVKRMIEKCKACDKYKRATEWDAQFETSELMLSHHALLAEKEKEIEELQVLILGAVPYIRQHNKIQWLIRAESAFARGKVR